MKKHVYTVFGLLMLAIFLWRGIEAIFAPGLGWDEVYIAGGILLAIVVTMTGIRLHLAERKSR
jgi:hypothetical protein